MVNLLLTGPTGTCGRAVLHLALLSPLIHSILVLTRRPLPDELGSRKLRTLLHKDFSDLSPLAADIAAFAPTACIWCLGGSRRRFASLGEFEGVTVGMAVGAAGLFARLAGGEGGATGAGAGGGFRFVFLSGYGAVVSGKRNAWEWVRGGDALEMAIKGRAERELFRLSSGIGIGIADSPGDIPHPTPTPKFELYTFRPGDPPQSGAPQPGPGNGGGGGGGGVKEKLKNWMQPTCPNEVLAAAMIGVAIKGFGEEGVSVFFENREILVVGREWMGKLAVGGVGGGGGGGVAVKV